MLRANCCNFLHRLPRSAVNSLTCMANACSSRPSAGHLSSVLNNKYKPLMAGPFQFAPYSHFYTCLCPSSLFQACYVFMLLLSVCVVTWTACFSHMALMQGGWWHLLVIGFLADNAILPLILSSYQCCSISLSPSPCPSLALSLSGCRFLNLSYFCDAWERDALKGYHLWHLPTTQSPSFFSVSCLLFSDHRWLDVHSLQGLCCVCSGLRFGCCYPCSGVNIWWGKSECTPIKSVLIYLEVLA